MFPARYFNPRYWASRYFPKVGAAPAATPIVVRLTPEVLRIPLHRAEVLRVPLFAPETLEIPVHPSETLRC